MQEFATFCGFLARQDPSILRLNQLLTGVESFGEGGLCLA
jgi:hypothetical protein